MRDLLTANLPGVEVHDGTAEALPLADGAVRAVFVAEAFHWFDGAAALAEIARVLAPGGGVVLLWNLPAGPAEPPVPETVRGLLREAFARGGQPGGPLLERGGWRRAFPGSRFGPLRHQQIAHEVVRDHDGMVANLMSISSVAGLPADERQRLRTALAAAIPRARYRRPLVTDLYWARLAAGPWCDRCGRALAGGGHEACAAARALEPPRFCPWCRRRMRVQVLPDGWHATCTAHGEIASIKELFSPDSRESG
jgi:SAM-dependent methyltransferase